MGKSKADLGATVTTPARPALTIRLGLPPRALHPNTPRVHWSAKHTATKAYRTEACMEALNALQRRERPRWVAATAKVVFYFNKKRRRDGTNYVSALKACWDGLQDAGILANDSGLTVESVEIVVDPTAREGVRIMVEER